MANFRYKGRQAGGAVTEGVLEAANVDAVANQLIAMGVTPVEIREQAERRDALEDLRKLLTAQAPTLEDLILFSRQLYTLMRAGVPINQAMTGLIRSTHNQRLAGALREVQADLEGGRDLSTALSRHPRIFSSLYINTIRIGEHSGQLDAALLRLAEYLDLERDTRARIKSALRYPTFVVVAIGIAIGIINIIVVPAFANVFERAGVALPIYTRIIISTSNFFVAYWIAMFVGIVVLIFTARSFVRTERGRYLWDRYKIRIPIIGSILYRATLGRFARSFSMSLAAGVPLLQALTVVSRAVDNEYLGGKIMDIRTGVERGDSLTRSAAATGMFTPLVVQMLSVGEESSAVDDLLSEVAGFYEREVDYDIKNLSQTIEPVLIIFIAGMVLILALGVFLPMWDMASVKLG